MVVDDVQDDAEAACMTCVDETSQVIWRTVLMEGCVEEHAVIAPAPIA